MIERFCSRLRGQRTFRQLLGECPTRSEVAVGVLALLTLARRREIEVEQPERFGEIWVRPRSEP
ncbi:Segregation and condensation protein A [bacterium HR27]|nr:Segregation and condensation protein A [bacterium HR27]